MAESKWEKYVIRNPINEGNFAKRLFINGSEHFPGLNYWLRWNYINQPYLMEVPHKHDYDQVFHLFGADSSNITDFQAEVYVHIGDEDETIKVTGPAIIYVPKGTMHCPIDFKRVDKPIIWMNIAFPEGDYIKTLTTGERLKRRPGT
jgi:hypothetical protein